MSESDIDVLYEKGLALIEDQNYEEAIKAGEQLKASRHTSAFEILALAYAGLGDLEQAIETLEDGVQKGPSVWLLWLMLGNCRSDAERYSEAHEAYEQALRCPVVEESSVHLNASIAMSRENRLQEAKEELSLVIDPELQPRAKVHLLGIINDEGRYEDAIRDGEQMLTWLESVDADTDTLAEARVQLGRAHWEGRRSRERALGLAWDALEYCRAYGHALWLISMAALDSLKPNGGVVRCVF
ncbi:MAG: tetratricopeptide repeat protein [bacterium]|nr:tetratricopeptide repeat protein [bacterium]